MHFKKMFCDNGTLYLEETLKDIDIVELSRSSAFCHFAFSFIKYSSPPLGISKVLSEITDLNVV